jgi:hypothetical protein
MTRKSVGYFEGTDSRLLTALVLSGYDTIPVSNGIDHHGNCIRQVNDQSKYDILIGYPHKITAQPGDDLQTDDILHICRTYSIPLILEVPIHLQEQVRELLPETRARVELIDPTETLGRALELLA